MSNNKHKEKHGELTSPCQTAKSNCQFQVYMANGRAFRKHLKRLVKKYGAKNVPLDEACNFKIKWKCKRKSVNKDA